MRGTRLPELLAPAGGPAAFRAALAGGADAIYCALGDELNARRGAENFDERTFAEACRMAHLAGARVYLALNVVVRESELPRALALVARAWRLGADAVIIQDWGLMAEVGRLWPQVERHVSTQANVHDARGARWCRDVMGAARVTLSRELSLAEVGEVSATGMETEVFGHGALCFCYSGLCLLSSLNGGRSANRGLCAQPCRLPYELVDRGSGERLSAPGRGRPLCPKDACTVDDLAALASAGTGSLKVEGRMKAPDYVLSVTSAYRSALDALAAGGEDPEAAGARHRALRRSFNRDFTDAYLHGTSGDELMSYGRSNNRGQLVGAVVSSRRLPDAHRRSRGANGGRERVRTVTRAEVVVALDEPVGKGDLLEFRPEDDPSRFLTAPVPADAAAGERVTCVAARPMPAGCPVRLIRSQAALDAAARVAETDVPRRRAVDVRVTARLGRPLEVELSCADGSARARATGGVVTPARTRAVTAEDLVAHASRLGGTPFEARRGEAEVDEGVGLSFSELHHVRAEAARLLERAVLAPWEGREELVVPPLAPAAPAPRPDDAELRRRAREAVPCVIAPTPEVAAAALAAGARRAYVPAAALAAGDFPEGCVPVLDEVCRAADHALLDPLVRPGEPVAVGNVSELALAAERGAAAELRGCVPVHNVACLRALEAAGAAGLWLSPEVDLGDVAVLAGAATVPVGAVVWGRARVMTSEHCVLQVAKRCVHDCARCALRRRDLALRSIDGDLYPVRTDALGRSRVYAARPLDAVPEVADLLACGVSRLAVDATLLDAEGAAREVARLVAALDAVARGRRAPAREAGADAGRLRSPLA